MAAARPYDVVTFDCYGTLIDWERGIREALVRVGPRPDPEVALATFHEIEPVVQAESYRSYRDVLTETTRRVGARLGWPVDDGKASLVAESLPGWPPFSDTNPALERLAAAGYRLGILSNVDDDLLAGTRRHFRAPFDIVITAQQVRAYKPAVLHFEAARGRVEGRRWLHAAQSYFHDVVPARAQNVPVAWINRKGERPGGAARPDREFRTLAELADWLAPAPAA
jgi:2-haloalkanoic acid dehalogenase type II